MNIFMTGGTVAQCDRHRRPQIFKFDFPRDLVSLLRAGGHHVEWRAGEVGKPLPKCDLVWVNASSPVSIHSPFALGAWWTMHAALEAQVPLVVFFDDWQFRGVYSGYRTSVNIGARQFTKTLSGHYLYAEGVKEAVENADKMFDLASQFNEADSLLWKHAVRVVPKFRDIGDITLVRKQMPSGIRVQEIDPSPFIPNYLTLDSTTTEKRRAWTLASLMPHERWLEKNGLGTGWPVDFFGSMKMKAPRLKTEQDVYVETAKRWGVLAPGYPQAGSGWFRTRFAYSAYAMSVLLCDPADGWALGKPFLLTREQVENASNAELSDFAWAQANLIHSRINADKASVLSTFEELAKMVGA